MYTLNVRLAVLLLVGVGVSGGGVHWVHEVQVHRHARSFLAQAEKAKDEKNLSAAIEFLKSYLSLSPDDWEVQQKLGLWLVEAKRFPAAYDKLEQVLRQDPNAPPEVRQELVKVAIAIQRWQDAVTHARILCQNDPDNPELLMTLGRLQLILGRAREAEDLYWRVILFAPDTIDAYTSRAIALQRLERPKEADECMQQLITNNPASLPARVLYGTYLLRSGRFDEASKQAKKVLELAPDNYQGVMLAGQSALQKAYALAAGKEQEQQYAEAKEYAEQAIRIAAGAAAGYQLLAQAEAKTRHRDEALATLQRGIEKTAGTPGYPGLLWEVAQMHLDNGKPLEAQKIAEQLKRLNADPTPLKCLDARIEMELGHWTAALAGFDSVRPELAANRMNPQVLRQVDYWTGLCYAQTGNVEQEFAAYDRAVKIDPHYFPARDGIAKIYITAGRLSDAIAEYQQAIKAGKPDEQVMVALARTMILRNLRMPEAQRDWGPVETVLAEAKKIAPNSPQLPLLQAEVLTAQNRLPDAEKLLLDLTNQAPNNLDFWLALAEIDERQSKWELAREHLQQVADKLGDSVPLRAARARYLLRHKGNDAAREIQKLAEENLDKFSSEDRVQLWKGLFPYSIQANDYATARRLCQAAAEKEPNNVRIRYALFELILRSQNQGAAGNEKAMADLERVLGEMEAAGGQEPLWLYGKAVQLKVQAKDDKDSPLLEQALRCIAKAREMRPSWPPLPLLAARIYEIQKKEAQMLQNDVQAINLGERDPAVVKRTVQLLDQRQRYDEADALFSKLAEGEMSLTPEEQREREAIKEEMGRDPLENIVQIAERGVKEDSQNYKEHLWLGDTLGRLASRAKTEQRPDLALEYQQRAEKALRRALELNGRSADARVALVRLLASSGQKEKAREEIKQAEEKLPRAVAALALGHCYEAVGQVQEAGRRFEEALAAAPDSPARIRELASFDLRNGKASAAEPQLKRLLKGAEEAKGADAEANAVWARHAYADLLRQRGGFHNLAEALRLIDRNVASSSGTVDDRRMKVKILLRDPRRARLQEATRTLEELIRSGRQVTTQDRFELAQLYLRQGDWNKYFSAMRDVFAARNPDPACFLFHIAALMQHRDLSEADVYLARLEQSAPDEPTTIDLRAELLLNRKEYSKAVDLLTAYLERTSSEPAKRLERQRSVARIAERCARKLTDLQQDAATEASKPFARMAETLLRSYVKRRPDQEPMLAAYLGRQGRIRESLDLAAQSWKSGTPEGLATIAAAIVHNGAASEAEYAALDQILQAAVKQFKRPLLLLQVQADSCLMRQRYPAAEEIYREILARDADNAAVLNSLSLLLAFEGKRLDESLRLIDRAIDIAGPVPDLLDSRATVYIAREEPEPALADLQDAIADEAVTGAATPLRYFHQARAYLLAGRKVEAVEAMRAAEKQSLQRSMLDPPERPLYDKLRAELES